MCESDGRREAAAEAGAPGQAPDGKAGRERAPRRLTRPRTSRGRAEPSRQTRAPRRREPRRREPLGPAPRVVALSFAALLSAFWPAPSRSAFGQSSQAGEPRRISASELERLAEISRRLSLINERLKTELEDSRRSSEDLAALLESSRRELEALRLELEASRTISTGLASRAESSERDSASLREALTRAQVSLESSTTSFEAYRRAAEARLRRAERGKRLLALAAASGWAAALGLLLFGG